MLAFFEIGLERSGAVHRSGFDVLDGEVGANSDADIDRVGDCESNLTLARRGTVARDGDRFGGGVRRDREVEVFCWAMVTTRHEREEARSGDRSEH